MHPTMIPAASPLAAVSGVFNAVFMTGDAVGDLMFYGRGAGQLPTASAVWSDVRGDRPARSPMACPPLDARAALGWRARRCPCTPMDDDPLQLLPARDGAQDRPGVLSQVAGILGENDISIASVIQKGRGPGEAVPVVMMTHEARERDMRAALAAIDRLPESPPPPR